MTLSGAFAAAAAVRRRPQHLVSHSARPALQGLLLLPTYMLCYYAVLLRMYTIHLSWDHLCFIRPEQQHFALLGNTTLKQTHMCRRRPVLPVVPTYQCQMSMPSVLYRLYLHPS